MGAKQDVLLPNWAVTMRKLPKWPVFFSCGPLMYLFSAPGSRQETSCLTTQTV